VTAGDGYGIYAFDYLASFCELEEVLQIVSIMPPNISLIACPVLAET
jgi:hypothetical protein